MKQSVAIREKVVQETCPCYSITTSYLSRQENTPDGSAVCDQRLRYCTLKLTQGSARSSEYERHCICMFDIEAAIVGSNFGLV